MNTHYPDNIVARSLQHDDSKRGARRAEVYRGFSVCVACDVANEAASRNSTRSRDLQHHGGITTTYCRDSQRAIDNEMSGTGQNALNRRSITNCNANLSYRRGNARARYVGWIVSKTDCLVVLRVEGPRDARVL